jgi:hypothetical protein
VVAAVVIAAGMTACSSAKSDSAPTKLSPAAASPVTSPSPSPTPEAQVDSAVRTYFATANEAIASGDTGKLVSLSRPSCQCRKLVDEIAFIHDRGHADGGHFELTSVGVQESQGTTAAAEVQYNVSGYRIIDSQGQVVRQYPAGSGHDLVSLVRQDARWLFDSSVNMKAEGSP